MSNRVKKNTKAPITVWERFNTEEEIFEHKHIENNHSGDEKPKPKFDLQKGWIRSLWRKKRGYLENLVVKIEKV